MSDEEFGRLTASVLINGPLVTVGAAYWLLTIIGYRRRKDSRALREFVVACGLLAAGLAYWALALGIIDAFLDVSPVFRLLTFVFRVVVFSSIVICIRSWWRSERR